MTHSTVYYAHIDGRQKRIQPLDDAPCMWSLGDALSAVQRLERRTFPRSEHTWPDQKTLRLNPRQHLIIAYTTSQSLETKDVSMILLGYLTLQIDPARAQVLKLAVTPTHRRQGIGTMLVQHTKQLVVLLGRSRCELHVDPERDEAYRLYLRCGFREHRVVSDYYGSGRHAMSMRWTVTDE
jgi:ribosomal protein S18 acetylase RimI-like enzyme